MSALAFPLPAVASYVHLQALSDLTIVQGARVK